MEGPWREWRIEREYTIVRLASLLEYVYNAMRWMSWSLLVSTDY